MKTGIHKKLENTLLPNTTTEIVLIDGVETSYIIRPIEGYKLHTKELDSYVFDEEAMTETDQLILGFTKGFTTCRTNYDFEENPREIYTVKE